MKRNTLVKRKVRNPSQLTRLSRGRPRKMKFSKKRCYGPSCQRGRLTHFITQQQIAEKIPFVDFD